MFVFKRNQIIITALVFMVAIAAYLNFTDTKNVVQPTFEDEGKTVNQTDDSTYTDYFLTHEFDDIDTLAPDFDQMDEEQMALEENILDEENMNLQDQSLKDQVIAENKTAQSMLDNETVVVNKNYDVNYFIEARMDREQKRSEQIEILTECVSDKTLDKESKADAAANLITLQERIEKESAIESLLKAKGFKEVFVRMSDNDVDVVIDRENLEEAEIAQIEDIVRRKTGYTTSQIKISPLKN